LTPVTCWKKKFQKNYGKRDLDSERTLNRSKGNPILPSKNIKLWFFWILVFGMDLKNIADIL